jgi:hypothetical protein
MKRLPEIGWREWISLPDFGVRNIKVKVDTGARSSSLHAYDLEYFRRRGREYVRFEICPHQRSSKSAVVVEAPVLEHRSVRSSSGKASKRPVIITNIAMLGEKWPIEVTLANRDEMGFRMLLGRQAVRGRFLVNPGQSYYGGKPKRRK